MKIITISNISLSSILIMLLVGCSSAGKPGKLSKQELIKYISNKVNRLIQEQEINGINIKLSYRPFSMLTAQELEAKQNTDTASIKAAESKYSGYYYFLLQFSKNGKEAIRQLGSFSNYSDMLQVLSFKMSQFIKLTTPQKDTVELADYLYDQTYGMSDGNTALLSFGKTKIKDSKAIEINIGECGFGTGALKFTIAKKDIDKVPMLDYSRLL